MKKLNNAYSEQQNKKRLRPNGQHDELSEIGEHNYEESYVSLSEVTQSLRSSPNRSSSDDEEETKEGFQPFRNVMKQKKLSFEPMR